MYAFMCCSGLTSWSPVPHESTDLDSDNVGHVGCDRSHTTVVMD